jgi:hypothetical protein
MIPATIAANPLQRMRLEVCIFILFSLIIDLFVGISPLDPNHVQSSSVRIVTQRLRVALILASCISRPQDEALHPYGTAFLRSEGKRQCDEQASSDVMICVL